MKLIYALFFLSLIGVLHGRDFNVTTTADVFDTNDCSDPNQSGPDGLLSLREAVCITNVIKGSDVIILPQGNYLLSIGSPGDNTNNQGDLDIVDNLHILGSDPNNTFISNAIGSNTIDGDGDRLLEVIAENNDVSLTIENLKLNDADVGCSSANCLTGGGVIHFTGSGTLSLINTVIENNQNSCSGPLCGDLSNTAVLTMADGGRLNMTQSVIQNNQTFCSHKDGNKLSCTAGTNFLYVGNLSQTNSPYFNFTASNSHVINNDSTCSLESCEVGNIIEINGNVDFVEMAFNHFNISNNSLSCIGQSCDVGSLFRSEALFNDLSSDTLTVNNNHLSCLGDYCNSKYIMRIDGDFQDNVLLGDQLPQNVSLINAQFHNNTLTCTGEECTTSEFFKADDSESVTINNGSFLNNTQTCFGDNCDTDELIELCCGTGNQTMTNTVIANNIHHCEGEFCDTDEILEVGTNFTGFNVMLNQLQVIDNETTCTGASCRCDVAGIYFQSENGINSLHNTTIARNLSQGDDNSCLDRATGGLRNKALNLLVTNTTIHGNRTVGSGAGILNSGNITLDHVTITDNHADIDNNGVGFGSGICNNFVFQNNSSCGLNSVFNATIYMSNTILQNNNNLATDCYDLIESDGFNIISDDTNCNISGDYLEVVPLMQPLQNNNCTEHLPNGSCVFTQLVQQDSPALDSGSCFSGQMTDQRGIYRPHDVTAINNTDDGCDIGATESFSDLIFTNGFEG